MRDDFNDYLAFIAVAEAKSFTRAAINLGISQSTLSHTIRRLEERLGLPLLMRTTRRVAPTEIGEMLLQILQPRLDGMEDDIAALLRFRDTPAGTVRLTVSDHMIHDCIWPRLAPVLKEYPDVKVELSQQNGFVDIIEGRFDAGVRIGDDIVKDMVAVRIGPDIRFIVIGSPAYLKQHGYPAHPSELEQHNCINIRHSPAGSIYAWEFEKQGQPLQIKVEGQLIFSSIYPMLAAVTSGYGLAYLPESLVADELQQGIYCRVLDEWCPPVSGYHLYYPGRRQISPALAVMIKMLRYPLPDKI
ncbi:LysR family transcriptional regulator [Klebsiella sp. BIGb0407]|uniref:LysR family transcriptional regulator n=1 Tax=Klebsiella sp. BIGb0407 TaxID=2940603 RepID=UPI002167B235|nr:LysR family transcriptional regulator [Klebsiella sp. BIGb0407]MCS3429711.1 DNA-binding transcriptional LysR family regulator [Klebsiella sp. BIGb0407]